ncbi:hypothetical protein Afil01_63890 [Actinorhabdospora filicis]|uniref:histidine kinase n=1 Tax=Actinorhabdospora filicis TaxID=1785913 RepID=A0A9W6SSM7_9ACTN|nr:sensor histidine kinase [Actinorhabdospora filicis]GLZ81582.1 hypothetical protein Afil01_63890 [Actinorhabdospora filicis]
MTDWRRWAPTGGLFTTAVLLVAGVLASADQLRGGAFDIALGAGLLLSLGATLLLRRRSGPFGVPAQIYALIAVVVVCLAVAVLTDRDPIVFVLLWSVGIAAVRHPPMYSFAVGGLAVTGLLLAGWFQGDVRRDLYLCFSISIAYLVGYSVRQRRATRVAEAHEAVHSERARIARELHDLLAHSLSAQVVHLEAARLQLRAHDTDAALERVELARDLARRGLDEARSAVAALREDLPPLPSTLRSLAAEFATATGRDCEVVIDGEPRPLPTEAALAVTRTAQEALTNVRRHAPGSPARVVLAFGAAECVLEITNPASPTPGEPGGGYGLVGMRERAELLSGTLETTTGDVFTVRLRIPV